MKIFRSIISAFLVLLGVMMIVAWAMSVKSVQALENGTAAAKLTDHVLSDPQVADLAADKVTAKVHDELSAQFDSRAFDLLWGFAQEPIHDAVVSAISSDFVADAAAAGASRIQSGLVEALTKKDRPYGPLMLTIDISPRINAKIDEIPRIGTFIPDITVAPLETEVVEAQVFEDIRTAYSSAKWVATWFVWIGLVLIALGVLVSPKRRWFLARAMLVAGAIVLAIGFTIGAIGAHTIASFMPGGADGGLGTTVDDLLSDTAIPPITELLIRLGIFALAIALVTALLVRFVPIFRDRVRTRREENAVPLVHEQAAATAVPAAVPAGAAESTSVDPDSVSIPTSVSSSMSTQGHSQASQADAHTAEAKTLELTPDMLAAAAEPPVASTPDAKTEELTPQVLAAAAKSPATADPVVKKPAAKKPAWKASPKAASAAATKKPATPKKPAAKTAPKKPAAKKPAPKSEPPTPN